MAVLIEGNAYLFDPTLGLPIPAPDGVKLDDAGRLVIQPATLAQAAADDSLLRRLDADEKHPYRVKAADLKNVVVLLEGSPTYLAGRMQLVESRLVGLKKMVLTTSPSVHAEAWKAVTPADVRLWLHPFETIQRRSHLSPQEVQVRLVAMLPFYAMPSTPLRKGRLLHLKGKFVGADGAIQFYQAARPSNQELVDATLLPIEKMIYLRAKQDASYWLGLVSYHLGNYPAAIDYFTKRTLLAAPASPWATGARYNLARTYEASGETQRAILQYQSDESSPGYQGDLLRAKWLGELKEGKKGKGTGEGG